MFYIAVLFIVLLDQVTKLWVRLHMAVGESIPVWDGFQLTHIENSGAMGSSFEGYGRYFIIPALLVVIWMFYLRHQKKLDGFMLKLGAAFFAGGALGNAIDRILFGKVTDFIDMGRGISNLADHALNVGVLLFLLSLFVVEPLKKKRLSRWRKRANE